MRLGAGEKPETYRIFLSSGDDAHDLRNRVDDLIREAINSQLMLMNAPVRFEVDRWERTAPHRAGEGQEIIDEFVERALKSNMVLTLLISRLRDGTRAELEAALEADVEISALWFVPQGTKSRSGVANFLKQERKNLLWDQTGHPDSQQSWEGTVRLLVAAMLEALQEPGEAYSEAR